MLPASWLNWLRSGSVSAPNCTSGVSATARGDAQSSSAGNKANQARREGFIGLFWHNAKPSGGWRSRRGRQLNRRTHPIRMCPRLEGWR